MADKFLSKEMIAAKRNVVARMFHGPPESNTVNTAKLAIAVFLPVVEALGHCRLCVCD